MHIALYSRVFPPAIGGMERFAADLAQWLAATGHDVTVLTSTQGSSELDRDLRVLRSPSPTATVSAMARADVVHVNGLSVRGIAFAMAARRAIVITHQGHQLVCPTGLAWVPESACTAGPRPGPCASCPARGPRGSVTLMTHRLAAHPGVNVAVSRYLARRLGVSAADVIYNPVADSAFLRRPGETPQSKTPVVAFAGRLVREKGLHVALRALSFLGEEVRFEVAGDGPMRATWQSLANELGLRNRVRWLGALHNLVDLYARATVIVVPSLCDEAFGYAAAEAMAAGVPVVATPRGALVELVADGRGYLASACTPAALAEAVRTALSDRGATVSAERAHQFVREHAHIDRIGPKYLAMYKAAIARHDPARKEAP
ncbi:MAG: hypothetical protein C4321_01935 [Chloroflexota bacterium]